MSQRHENVTETSRQGDPSRPAVGSLMRSTSPSGVSTHVHSEPNATAAPAASSPQPVARSGARRAKAGQPCSGPKPVSRAAGQKRSAAQRAGSGGDRGNASQAGQQVHRHFGGDQHVESVKSAPDQPGTVGGDDLPGSVAGQRLVLESPGSSGQGTEVGGNPGLLARYPCRTDLSAKEATCDEQQPHRQQADRRATAIPATGLSPGRRPIGEHPPTAHRARATRTPTRTT